MWRCISPCYPWNCTSEIDTVFPSCFGGGIFHTAFFSAFTRVTCQFFSTGSWGDLNPGRRERPSSEPKPRSSPTSISRTSARTWTMTGWKTSLINMVISVFQYDECRAEFIRNHLFPLWHFFSLVCLFMCLFMKYIFNYFI